MTPKSCHIRIKRRKRKGKGNKQTINAIENPHLSSKSYILPANTLDDRQ